MNKIIKITKIVCLLCILINCNKKPDNKSSTFTGEVVNYYEDGKVKEKSIYEQGIKILNSLHYFNNGNIKHIEFYDIRGKLKYLESYNSNQMLISRKGKPFFFAFYPKQDSLTVNRELSIYVYSAKKVDGEAKFIFGVKNDEESEYSFEEEYIIKNKQPLYKKKFKSFGKKEIIGILSTSSYRNINYSYRDTIIASLNILPSQAPMLEE